jgi:hypothetical protein
VSAAIERGAVSSETAFRIDGAKGASYPLSLAWGVSRIQSRKVNSFAGLLSYPVCIK